MSDSLSLPLLPSTFWLHAKGEGGGADFDLVMDKDRCGLPQVRASHINGLLRLALDKAGEWEWFRDTPPAEAPPGKTWRTVLLLGDPPRTGNRPGCLAVSDATVSPALSKALTDEKLLVRELFVRVASTAIDPATGAARRKHLRTVEAAHPTPLHFTLSFSLDDCWNWARGNAVVERQIRLARKHWPEWIETAWPAFDEIGAKRTRGFGTLAWTGEVGE